MAKFFAINGIELPVPARGLQFKRTQFVDSARNAKGEVVAQKINRRIYKFENLVWKYLDAPTWRIILKEIEKFDGELYFFNNLSGQFETIKVYWGDASEEVHKIDPNTGEVLEYLNCSCAIIDMGL